MVNLRPYISEKSVSLTKGNKFTILVSQDAKREEIIQLIRKIFNLKPKSIKIIRQKSLIERKIKGYAKNRGYKKAIVQLSKNEVIPGFETFSESKEDKKKDKK